MKSTEIKKNLRKQSDRDVVMILRGVRADMKGRAQNYRLRADQLEAALKED